jgi:hypothetical protein
MRKLLLAAVAWIICQPLFLRSEPADAISRTENTPPKYSTTNSLEGKWHTIQVTPRRDLPKIHFYDKLNPVWWLKNSDEPAPPADYKPHDKLRKLKWNFRNPFHNFSNYVIGISDKKFTRSGRYPDKISSPRGGWNFSVAHRTWRWLPLISYRRGRFEFYLGWRERGNFGAKINVTDAKKSKQNSPAHLSSPSESKSLPAP